MSDHDSTQSLVLATGMGDRESMDRLLERHVADLRLFVRLKAGPVVRAREESSDLVQSVCLELLNRTESFEWRGEPAFRAWLFRAAERKIIDRVRYWRAAKRDADLEVDGGDPTAGRGPSTERATPGRWATPSALVAEKEELERVERAFDALPHNYRDVILSSKILGLSHAEIGVQMGRSEGAARSLLHRAMADLAEHLGSEGLRRPEHQ